MPQFSYQARDSQGRKIVGKVEANSKEAAASVLHEKHLLIISLQQRSDTFITELSASMSKVKADDIVNFTRQLATMINAGLPLLKAFAVLDSQAKPAMRKVIRRLNREIEGGANFGDSLTKEKQTFSTVYVALVQAGEAAGALDTILLRLADTLEKQKEFRAKTKGALIYPGIVLSAMLIVAVIMMIFVIPQMMTLYEDFDADLPVATQILMDASAFFQQRWYVLGIGAVIGFFIFTKWKKTKRGRHQYDRMMLHLPVFGPLRREILSTEFARTMALMVSAGISILEALEIVGRSMDNVIYQDAVFTAREDVEKGKALSSSLSRLEVFPELVTQMIAVGEETGKLDDVLQKLAAYYESESEHTIKGLTTALEPIIMVVLGLGVGFLIIAIIMPIYSLTSQF
jgi:type IV pilus assembly protein PilC